MKLHLWIQQKRQEIELTQAELGSLIGVNPTTVGRIEQGEIDLNVETALAIFHTLGTAPDAVLAALAVDNLEVLKTRERDETMLNRGDIANLLNILELRDYERWRDYGELFDFLSATFSRLFSVLHDYSVPVPFGPFSWMLSDLVTAHLNHPGIGLWHDEYEKVEPSQPYIQLITEIIESGGALTIEDIGMFIRALRKEAGLTIGKLHKKAGKQISTTAISNLERGAIGNLSIHQAIELGRALSRPVQILRSLWLATEIRVLANDAHFLEPKARFKAVESVITLWRWLQVEGYSQYGVVSDIDALEFVQTFRELSSSHRQVGRIKSYEMISANVPNTTNDFVFHYNPPQRDEGICRVRIFRRGRQAEASTVVVLTALDDNRGAGVTEAFETIAATLCWQQSLNPERVIWVEHQVIQGLDPYMAPTVKEHFHITTVEWHGQRARNPLRFPVSKECVESLMGGEL